MPKVSHTRRAHETSDAIVATRFSTAPGFDTTPASLTEAVFVILGQSVTGTAMPTSRTFSTAAAFVMARSCAERWAGSVSPTCEGWTTVAPA